MGLVSEVMGAIVGQDVDLGDLYNNIGTTGQLAQGGCWRTCYTVAGDDSVSTLHCN